jgi:hypothetical protein
MILLGVSLLLFAAFLAFDVRRTMKRRRKRKGPGPVRNGLTPEEVEFHFDEIRRKRSAEMKKRRDEPKP